MINRIKHWVRNNEYIFYRYYTWYYTRKIKKAHTIWVITTPGHVGSSTTYHSLKNALQKDGVETFDIHSVFEKFNNKSNIPSHSARHILQEVLMRSYPRYKKNKIWNIVTLVRDPVARALGGLFQSKEVFMPDLDVKKLGSSQYKEGMEKILNILSSPSKPGNTMPFLEETSEWQVNFFRKEVGFFWGYPVEHIEVGGSLHHYDNLNRTNYFVLHLENLEKELLEIGERVGKPIKMFQKNSAHERLGKQIDFYDYCKKSLVFPLQRIERIYYNGFWSKVYSEKEVDAFIKSWTKNNV